MSLSHYFDKIRSEHPDPESNTPRTGIPHRRGYLLYGPPGTGKTSTIYALAGALNLEIYSLSLASNFVDDSFLQRAASAIPKHGLFLIEDIDCAFPSREDDEEEEGGGAGFEIMMQVARGGRGGGSKARRSNVTLSGLLNVIDGIGSEEGKLFFATTNHIDRLDAALLRPGRIDRKVQYDLATASQAHALFVRFFPAWRFPDPQPLHEGGAHALGVPLHMQQSEATNAEEEVTIAHLADLFAAHIPPGEFSTAELQGYLQGHKARPRAAAGGARGWVESVREERRAGERRREERLARARAKREGAGVGVGTGMGTGMQMQMGLPGMGVPGGMVIQTRGAGGPVPGSAVPGFGAVRGMPDVLARLLAVNGGNAEIAAVAAESLPGDTQTLGAGVSGTGMPGLGVGVVSGLGFGDVGPGLLERLLAVNGGNTELAAVAAENLPSGEYVDSIGEAERSSQ